MTTRIPFRESRSVMRSSGSHFDGGPFVRFAFYSDGRAAFFVALALVAGVGLLALRRTAGLVVLALAAVGLAAFLLWMFLWAPHAALASCGLACGRFTRFDFLPPPWRVRR